ncbi:hypothetical protein A2U01_0077390, partial [Trifolium medium]|nr:hypothetical protein [Trifolium medium]
HRSHPTRSGKALRQDAPPGSRGIDYYGKLHLKKQPGVTELLPRDVPLKGWTSH